MRVDLDRVVRVVMRVMRLRGVLAPEYCVMNVLGMLVPEVLIFYLFFFYFFWMVAGPVCKMEAVDHHAYPYYQSHPFFWPTLYNHQPPPYPTVQPEWAQHKPTVRPRSNHHINPKNQPQWCQGSQWLGQNHTLSTQNVNGEATV